MAPLLLLALGACLRHPAGDPRSAAAAHAFARGERSVEEARFDEAAKLFDLALSLAAPDDPYRDVYVARVAALRGFAPSLEKRFPSGVAVRLDRRGQRAVWLEEGIVRTRTLEGESVQRAFPAPDGVVWVCFSPDGLALRGADYDGNLMEFDAGGRVLHRWSNRPVEPGTFVSGLDWTGHVRIEDSGRITWDACLVAGTGCARGGVAQGAPDVRARTYLARVAASGDLVTLEATVGAGAIPGSEDLRDVALVAYGVGGGVTRLPLPEGLLRGDYPSLQVSDSGRRALVHTSGWPWFADFDAPLVERVLRAEQNTAELSSDGTRLIVTEDSEVLLLDPLHYEPLARRPFDAGLDMFQVLPDRASVATWWDGVLRVAPIASAKPCQTWQLGPIAAADFEGDLLVYATPDGRLRQRDVPSATDSALPAHLPRVDSVGESVRIDEAGPSGPRFWLADGASVVFTETGALLSRDGVDLPLAPPPGGVGRLSPDARWAGAIDPLDSVRLASTLTGTAVSFDLPHGGELLATGFSPDSTRFDTVDASGELDAWTVVPRP